LYLANLDGEQMKVSEKYRLKALACEKLGQEAQDAIIKRAWAEIAIEWHTLASRVAEAGQDHDIAVSYAQTSCRKL
jgi:hypothetical protein